MITKAVQRGLDLAAMLLLAAYALLARSALTGSAPGQALDPAFARMQSSGELRVAIDLGFAPFGGLADGEVIGYDADLARALALRLGAEARFVPTGFDALYDALARGDADMIASALSYTPAQSWRARFSRVYFNAGQVLLARRERGFTVELPLEGLRLGALLGSEGDTLLRRAEREGVVFVRRSDYDEPPTLLADLRAGALDAIVLDNASALAAANDDPTLVLLRALSFEPYALGLPPDAYRLHTEVDMALEELERSGCLAALNERWFTQRAPTRLLDLPERCTPR